MCCTKSKIVAAHNFVKDAAGRKIAHRMQRPSNAARLSYSTRFRLILYSPRHYFKSARFREVSSIGKDGATVAVGRAITYCPPPAQIRTCRINVYGSCLGFLRQSELWDKDAWLALGIGMNDRATQSCAPNSNGVALISLAMAMRPATNIPLFGLIAEMREPEKVECFGLSLSTLPAIFDRKPAKP